MFRRCTHVYILYRFKYKTLLLSRGRACLERERERERVRERQYVLNARAHSKQVVDVVIANTGAAVVRFCRLGGRVIHCARFVYKQHARLTHDPTHAYARSNIVERTIDPDDAKATITGPRQAIDPPHDRSVNDFRCDLSCWLVALAHIPGIRLALSHTHTHTDAFTGSPGECKCIRVLK